MLHRARLAQPLAQRPSNQSPKPIMMSPTPSSLAPACVPLWTLGSAPHMEQLRVFHPSFGKYFGNDKQRCERGSCCILHARMPTEPPEPPDGPVLMGIKHFVLKPHPCRAPYRPSLRDGSGLPYEEHTGSGGLRGLQG